MLVESCYANACNRSTTSWSRKQQQGSTLAGRWIADIKASVMIFVGDDEEAITGSVDSEAVYILLVVSIPEDGPAELAAGSPSMVTAEDTEMAVIESVVTIEAIDEKERGLATVVSEKEVVGGGGMAPQLAHSTAAKDVVRRQPDEYLPGNDRLWQVVEDGHTAAV